MNRNNDLISIIVTVYKNYIYLNDLIKSVESQTHKNYELIFINDGSDKKVINFLENYDFNEKNKIKIYNIKRFYRSKSLNYGISKSSSDIICILDSDDYWHPKKLELQLYYLKQLNLKFLATSSLLFYEDANIKISKKFLLNISKINHRSFFYTNHIPHSSVMAYKNLLQYNEKLFQNVDLDLWLRISQNIDIYKIELPLTFIRRHESQFFYGNTVYRRIIYFKNSLSVRFNQSKILLNKLLISIFILKFTLSLFKFSLRKIK
tara:strand:- start:252 stop:1040 length:789 start_codon:yes stop_codon:yes gene_type:complete